MLRPSPQDLCETYDLAMLDLDGVVYIGDHAVPGAAEAVQEVRRRGMHVAFVTNNASRPPRDVAAHLRELGIAADGGDVVTSSQAAARLVAGLVPTGARVLALGGPGVAEALVEAGLVPVHDADQRPSAVVSGYGPDLTWRVIMRAAVLIKDGLPWVAANADLTIPTSFGVAPGHGALVELLERFSGVRPTVAGKPQRPLLDETVTRVGGDHPLMVGDRLDTDIEGANAAGLDSLLVLTGVTGLAELAGAPAAMRPSYLAGDLAGLLHPHPAPTAAEGGWQCGGWLVNDADGRLRVEGSGAADDWWRAVASAAWAAYDASGTPVDVAGLEPGLPSGVGRGR